jgi:hypothetical protein
MNNSEFIIKYISEAAKSNKKPLDAAKDEVREIDSKLSETEPLKIRRMQLMDVIDHFGDSSFRKKRMAKSMMQEDVEFADNFELKDKIKQIIAQNGPMNNRELIIALRGIETDAMVIRTVKNMGIEEILGRDENNLIVKGQNF